MLWNEIVGHADNINKLKAMLAVQRVPHALLFAGPDGVGKAAAAKVFAASLLCSGSAEKPCGSCQSCRQISTNSHPDLLLARPAGASIKIDQVRELQREAALAPYYGERRVIIIEGAECMTTQAANSLLKTLEEPVGNLVFILVSNARQQLLDTIISRCRVLNFSPLPYQILSQALSARGFAERQAEAAARLSGGRMGNALALLAENGLAARNQAAELITSLPGCSMTTLWEQAAVFDKMERPQVLAFFNYMSYILRDLLVYISAKDSKLFFNADIAEDLLNEAHYWDEPRLLTALKALDFARKALAANANIRLTSEALLIKLRDAAGED